MRQRILGSHTPPCHRRMVITTQFSVLPCCPAAQPVLYNSRRLLIVLWPWPSVHVGQLAPTTLPQCRLVSNPCSAGLSLSLSGLSLCGLRSLSLCLWFVPGGGAPCVASSLVPRCRGLWGSGAVGWVGLLRADRPPGGGGVTPTSRLGAGVPPAPGARYADSLRVAAVTLAAAVPYSPVHQSTRRAGKVPMPFADPCVCVWACRVFTLGGGGVNRAPKNWGGGGSGKGLN